MLKKIKTLKNKILATAAGLLLLLLQSPLPSFAAGARLYLAPPSGNYFVGSYLPISVLVDTGGNLTNVYRATLTYSANLRPISVTTGGSICSLWIAQTATNLECGTIKAFKGTAGKIAIVNFTALSAGSAAVSVSSGNVKRADGAGTEILSTRESAEFAIQEPPAGTPVISSSSHPDQNAWYQNRTVSLAWEAGSGAQGFAYLLDQNPQTIPADSSLGTATAKTYPDLVDGIYYFHLKAKNDEGWSNSAHFKIQIDATAPLPFKIVSDPSPERVFRAPLLSFFTTDATSGINHYEVSLDGTVLENTAQTYYRFTRIRGGLREARVTAYDKAGNSQEAKLNLVVVSVPAPEILTPTEGETIPLFGQLPITVKISAAGTVEFVVDGENPQSTSASGAEEISFNYRKLLAPGRHELSATYINADGIESEPAKVVFNVTPWQVNVWGLTVPGYLFYPVTIAILLTLSWLIKRELKKIKNRRTPGKPLAPNPEKAPVSPVKEPENKEKKEKQKETK